MAVVTGAVDNLRQQATANVSQTDTRYRSLLWKAQACAITCLGIFSVGVGIAVADSKLRSGFLLSSCLIAGVLLLVAAWLAAQAHNTLISMPQVEQDARDKRHQADALEEANAEQLALLPPAYRHATSLTFMRDAIMQGKAHGLGEAASLFDKTYHVGLVQRLHTLQEEQQSLIADYQERINVL